jgi:hypothetical protein
MGSSITDGGSRHKKPEREGVSATDNRHKPAQAQNCCSSYLLDEDRRALVEWDRVECWLAVEPCKTFLPHHLVHGPGDPHQINGVKGVRT